MRFSKRLTALPFTALVTLASHAQLAPTPSEKAAAARANAEQNQQQQQQRESEQRDATVQARGVRSTVPDIDGHPPLPKETPCFDIETFNLEKPATHPLRLDPFAFAREWLDHYKGQCIGKTGVSTLAQHLQQLILSRGYITTRVLIPPQDLSTHTLTLTLAPGRVRQLRFADPQTRGTWKSAFPTNEGALLNAHDLDQGLEQMKRVASQDAAMKIEPTDTSGESDIVISVARAKPWSFTASVDNAGTDATGKWQGNIALGIDNPLGLNDLFTIGANQDLSFGNKTLGSHGFNGSYSIPWGYWTATLSGYTNTYYQNIAGVRQTFVSSGNAQTVALRLSRVLARNPNDVLSGYMQLSKRFGASFINDTTIPTQNRNNTFIEAGLTDRHYFDSSQFDGTLAYRQGIGGIGATPDPYAAGPTYRYHMAVLDANLSIPFSIATQNLRYVTTVHGQFTDDVLFYLDDLSIGSRYTVRGFDGNTMLAAEKGLYWRNELQWPVFKTGQTLYAGIDYGRVFGPNTAFLTGTQLAGAVVGIRGGVPAKYVGLSYDLSAATPLYKPSGFPASRVTVAFRLTAQF